MGKGASPVGVAPANPTIDSGGNSVRSAEALPGSAIRLEYD